MGETGGGGWGGLLLGSLRVQRAIAIGHSACRSTPREPRLHPGPPQCAHASASAQRPPSTRRRPEPLPVHPFIPLPPRPAAAAGSEPPRGRAASTVAAAFGSGSPRRGSALSRPPPRCSRRRPPASRITYRVGAAARRHHHHHRVLERLRTVPPPHPTPPQRDQSDVRRRPPGNRRRFCLTAPCLTKLPSATALPPFYSVMRGAAAPEIIAFRLPPSSDPAAAARAPRAARAPPSLPSNRRKSQTHSRRVARVSAPGAS